MPQLNRCNKTIIETSVPQLNPCSKIVPKDPNPVRGRKHGRVKEVTYNNLLIGQPKRPCQVIRKEAPSRLAHDRKTIRNADRPNQRHPGQNRRTGVGI